MEWDADLGVWKGSKASSYSEIPNPLYIFGYGSLLWRPGDLLSKYSATPCVCYGWKRLFAQRSMDHRGTMQYPGFVATLVTDTFFNEKNNGNNHTTPSDAPSECVGIAFLVPNEDIDELIAELDFREKGGYHRHVISVKLLEATKHHNQFDLANALVYTGPTDNPNFSLEFSMTNWETLISRIIAISVGPSGENAEYLLQLAAFVGQQLQQDEYLEKLAHVVFNTVCPWRGRLLLQRCNLFSENQSEAVEVILSPNQVEIVESVDDFVKCGPLLLAWGSNESYQLSGIESFQFHFKSSPFHLNRVLTSTGQDHLVMTPTHFGTFSSTIPQLIVNKNELYNPSLFHYQVYAGGSRSAIQCHTHLYLWGDLTSSTSTAPNDQSQHHTNEVKRQQKCWKKSFYLTDGTSSSSSSLPRLIVSQEEVFVESSVVIPTAVHSVSHSYETMTFAGVESIAMGHHHNLILSHDRTSVLAFGDDEYHQCSDDNSSFLLQVPTVIPSTKLTVAKLSAGLHHSASYGQCLSEDLSPWSAPQITENELRYCGVVPRVMDICCGAQHTVLLDTIGRVYTFGSNRSHSLSLYPLVGVLSLSSHSSLSLSPSLSLHTPSLSILFSRFL
jgi:glutathione-specific gamma-glutamylcyclotransferase